MAKVKQKKPEAPPAPARAPITASPWFGIGLVGAAFLVFYWIPLTSADASIQWDAVDVHYSSQKYFADRLWSGHLPFWTPYIYSGFPFLADPQVGAWYPLNWPFFLLGIGPRSIEFELALHALLAALGAYLFLLRLIGSRPAALLGAFAYAFSGFFAEHSSHLGMFSAASLLPWLLLFFDQALESAPLRNTVLAALTGGIMILAGHFQTALYAFAALALFAMARLIERPAHAARLLATLACVGIAALLLSAIQTVPGLELAGESIRANANYADSRDRVLRIPALANFFSPDATGIFAYYNEGAAKAAGETLYYLYSGILLLPLAAAGFAKKRALRILGVLLVLLPLWYMLGPDGFLYRLGAILPGFHRVRSPIHFLFVPLFGLAIHAAAGAAWIFERWKMRWLLIGLPLVFFLDVFYWNSLENPLAYARRSFGEFYGSRERLGQEKVALSQPSLTRFEMPEALTVFGSLNHPLDLKLEAVYGYNPLELKPYAEYLAAAQSNRKLFNGLNVSRYLDVKNGAILPNADALPRVYFARSIVSAPNPEESRRLLASLDPSQTAIVEGPAPALQPDPNATAAIVENEEQSYQIRYQSAAPGLLKIGVAWFAGWRATLNGRDLELRRVDHALLGVMLPAGQGEVHLGFHSTWFIPAAWVTGLTWSLCIAMLVWGGRSRQAGLS